MIYAVSWRALQQSVIHQRSLRVVRKLAVKNIKLLNEINTVSLHFFFFMLI